MNGDMILNWIWDAWGWLAMVGNAAMVLSWLTRKTRR